jgi:hypothetical protein
LNCEPTTRTRGLARFPRHNRLQAEATSRPRPHPATGASGDLGSSVSA